MIPRKRISVFLDQELLEGLKALKRTHGQPEAQSIREAIGAYLVRKGVIKADRRPVASRRRRP